jgi:hypothetical protein
MRLRWLAPMLLACSNAPASNDASAPDAAGLDVVTTSDSSASDAGDGGRDFSTDRGLFFGPSRCAAANVQLCEDFESGSVNPAIWSYVGTHPVVDGKQAARGSKALHVTVPGNGASLIKETETFPEPNDTYWGRIFVYFGALPTFVSVDAGLTYAHWTFAYATGTGPTAAGQIRLSGQLQKTGANYINHFGVGTDDRVDDAGTGDWTTSDDDPPSDPAAVPASSWVCIEWLHSGATNETRLFWDAVAHPSLHTTASVHGGNTNPYVMPQFDAVAIGWQEYQATTETFDMWVDEIAIDTARIGCVL